ncbi:MAG: hypothetical protein LQ342_005955 [Letrouitia transgressa]|nr:MAG: hypothetical protein LQ342_005955 [Letrouitia transgressa]
MRYNALLLLSLSVPFLTQAGPVSSTQSVNYQSRKLEGRAFKDFPGALVARAPPDDDDCDTTDTCKTSGQKNWDALQDKLKDDNAKDVDQYDKTLDSDYEDMVTKDATPDAATFKQVFDDLHLDFDKHFAEHEVAPKGGERVAFSNMFNTDQGAMVGIWNYKKDDTKATMPFSEVIFQCFKKECDDEKDLKKFKIAGVQNVANDEFLTVIKDIYEKRGLPKLPNKWNKFTYEDNKDDFLAFLGTPKLNFVLKMLTDHSVAFGKRVPKEVYTNYRTRGVYVTIEEFKN